MTAPAPVLRHHHAAIAVAAREAVADAVLLGVFAAQDEMTATARERRSARELQVVVVAVPFVRHAVVGLAPDAIEIVVQQHVDRACDGVRAVLGRGTTRHDIDAIHQPARDHVQVDRALARDRRRAAAIHQHQIAAGAQATQVQDLGADVETAPAIGGRRGRGAERRQLVHGHADVGDALVLHRIAVDGGHRRGRRESGLSQARARDDDLFQGITLGCGVCRECRGGHGAEGAGEQDVTDGLHGHDGGPKREFLWTLNPLFGSSGRSRDEPFSEPHAQDRPASPRRQGFSAGV